MLGSSNTQPVGSALGTSYAKKWIFALNNVQFQKQEVPEEFDLGHEIKVAEHRYINANGQPVVRTHFQGAYPVPTSWKGIFTTAVALQHAQTIDAMAIAGAPVKFTYGPLSWMVFIKKFRYTPHFQLEVHYEIELIVLKDLNGNSVSPFPQTFDSQVQQLYTNGVANFNTLYQTDPIIQNNAALQAELQAIGQAP
jgi:hypothetical protein